MKTLCVKPSSGPVRALPTLSPLIQRRMRPAVRTTVPLASIRRADFTDLSASEGDPHLFTELPSWAYNIKKVGLVLIMAIGSLFPFWTPTPGFQAQARPTKQEAFVSHSRTASLSVRTPTYASFYNQDHVLPAALCFAAFIGTTMLTSSPNKWRRSAVATDSETSISGGIMPYTLGGGGGGSKDESPVRHLINAMIASAAVRSKYDCLSGLTEVRAPPAKPTALRRVSPPKDSKYDLVWKLLSNGWTTPSEKGSPSWDPVVLIAALAYQQPRSDAARSRFIRELDRFPPNLRYDPLDDFVLGPMEGEQRYDPMKAFLSGAWHATLSKIKIVNPFRRDKTANLAAKVVSKEVAAKTADPAEAKAAEKSVIRPDRFKKLEEGDGDSSTLTIEEISRLMEAEKQLDSVPYMMTESIQSIRKALEEEVEEYRQVQRRSKGKQSTRRGEGYDQVAETLREIRSELAEVENVMTRLSV